MDNKSISYGQPQRAMKDTHRQPIKRTILMKRTAQESIREKLLKQLPLGIHIDTKPDKEDSHSYTNRKNITIGKPVDFRDKPNEKYVRPVVSTKRSRNIHSKLHQRTAMERSSGLNVSHDQKQSVLKMVQYMPVLPVGEMCSSAFSRTAPISSGNEVETNNRRQRPQVSTEMKHRLKDLFRKLKEAETNSGNTCVCKLGDGEIRSDDIRRLVTSPKLRGTDAWLNDELINSVTSLGEHLNWTKDAYILNSQTVETIIRAEVEVNNTQDRDRYEEQLNRMARRLIKSNRKGQLGTIVDASFVIAPTLVGGAHWVTFVVEKKNRKITLLDSLHLGTAQNFDIITRALSNFLCAVEKQADLSCAELTKRFIFEGRYLAYPTQSNGSDCGIFSFLGVHTISSGMQPAVDEKSIRAWRYYLALMILQHGTWSGNPT